MAQRFKPKRDRKPGPKRDRLLSYLKELVLHENSASILNSKKRTDNVIRLYGVPECVFEECSNEVKRWWKRRETIINA